MSILLGVNIDHVATLREARKCRYPDPVQAALVAEEAGADLITVHLREDRRHIQDRDVEVLAGVLQTRMNLEMALTEEMLVIAERIRPQDVCLVPEKRAELTTEGGLNVEADLARVTNATQRLQDAGILVSLFVDPDPMQLDASAKTGAAKIEIHTGRYAEAVDQGQREKELGRIADAASTGHSLGLQVNAGHGLNFHNVQPVAAISEVHELNIGHAIVGRAVFMGLGPAVREMKRLLVEARQVTR